MRIRILSDNLMDLLKALEKLQLMDIVGLDIELLKKLRETFRRFEKMVTWEIENRNIDSSGSWPNG